VLFRIAITILLLSVSGIAQTRGPGWSAGPIGHMGLRSIASAHGHHRFFPGYAYYGLPYFYSDYEPYEQYVPEPPPRPEPTPVVKIEPAPDPVLLELRSGQWVRVSQFSEVSGNVLSTAASSAHTSTKPLLPAMLVFRDGHTEEVSSYSIIGGAIYTKADYWSTGKWTRTIQLADLNIPATIEQNRGRGVDFALPSSPDEIMIRP
jgi:hypothetical protein